MARPQQGALRPQHSGRSRALLPDADAGRMDDVFQVPGKRTTGTGPQKYAITGPGWSGTLPAGVTEYKSPTTWSGFLGASIAPVYPRTTRPCMRCRTNHAGPAQFLRQALYAAAGHGRSEH